MIKVSRLLLSAIKSKFGLLCPTCKNKVPVGGMIDKDTAGKWVCLDCARGPAPKRTVYKHPTNEIQHLQQTCPICKGKGCMSCKMNGSYYTEVVFLTGEPPMSPHVKGLFGGEYYVEVSKYDPSLDEFIDPSLLPELKAGYGKRLEDEELKAQKALESKAARDALDRQHAEAREQESSKERGEIQSYMDMTIEEAKAQGLTIGTTMRMHLNHGHGGLPQYHPGEGKIPPHRHYLKDSSPNAIRGSHRMTCKICGAIEESDSGG